MWVELAIGVIASALGIMIALALGVKEMSEARIAGTQVSNFLSDFRADMNGHMRGLQDKLDELLERTK